MGLEKQVWNESDIFDVLIIGGGIAGMTAGIYIKRANLKVGFIESNIPGGKIVNESSIENIPSLETVNGADYAYKVFEQSTKLGVEYIFGKVTNVKASNSKKFIVATEDNVLRMAKCIIVATGSSERKLDIPGEEEYAHKGVSYCAICDGSFAKNKVVTVVGGGNSAVTGAIYLSKIAKTVNVIHRREEFKADALLVEQLKKISNINLVLNSEPIEIKGDKKLVSSIDIKNINTSKITSISTNFVFIYVGAISNIDFLSNDVKTDENKYIIVDNTDMSTNVEGIFAAGDCISKIRRQITMAMGDGTIAALSAIEYIQKHPNL